MNNHAKSPFAMSPKSKLVAAIAGIIAGVLLIIFRSAALDFIIRVMGIILIVGGLAVLLGGKVASKLSPGSGMAEMTLAGAAIIVGLICVIGARAIVNIFPVIMGIVLIIAGLSSLTGTLSMSDAARGSTWKISLVLSIVVIILGLLVLFHPGAIADAIVFFIGVSALVGGITQLSVYIKTRKDEPIDVNFREV